MRISAAGSNTRPPPFPGVHQAGFTLLELLVVVSIIAMVSVGVVFALRDSAQTQTEREAQRLAALLESARAQSRTSGLPVVWRASGRGFVFDGLPANTLPGNWLDSGTSVASGSQLELGPEPMVAAQSVTLLSSQQSDVAWRVVSDGLRPFSVQRASNAPASNAVGAAP